MRTISDINNEDKIFLLVIGGSASGKNFIYKKYFNFKLIDIDEYTKRLSNGDVEKARSFISMAIDEANDELNRSFKSGSSIAQVTTGSGLKGTENKIIKAKDHGFKTALILIDTDVETAIKRNHERATLGEQGLVPDWKVEKTNKEARETFNELKSIVYYSTVIKN